MYPRKNKRLDDFLIAVIGELRTHKQHGDSPRYASEETKALRSNRTPRRTRPRSRSVRMAERARKYSRTTGKGNIIHDAY
ncbi:MAG: hypothetical protein CL946_06590 [Ectothiorhodospiraceae bacterium]|nr:hypothetical protein [Ectothiorhodospiraceae bacterium]